MLDQARSNPCTEHLLDTAPHALDDFELRAVDVSENIDAAFARGERVFAAAKDERRRRDLARVAAKIAGIDDRVE